MAARAGPWPLEVRLSAARDLLTISFDDGRSAALPAEYLRVESPSAEVKGHGPGEAVTVPGKRDVRIEAVEPVGNYAVRLRFDDGHATGIYSWTYLDGLARNAEANWTGYLARLAEQGLTREG